MATSIHHDTRAGFGAAPTSIRGFADRYRAWSARRRQVNRVTAELNSYTERQLADLGLCKSDIPAVARGEFRRA